MNCRSSCAGRSGRALNGWQVSGSVFWHSGIPFSVLSAPYSANGNGIVNGSGPQFASVVPGVPLYEHNPIPGVTQPGTIQWLNPNAFVSTVDPSTGACAGGDTPQNCQFGNLGRNALRGPGLHLERSVPHQMVRAERAREAAHRRPVFQLVQSSELRASGARVCRRSRQAFHPDRLRRADVTPRRRPPDCSASGWAATVRRA